MPIRHFPHALFGLLALLNVSPIQASETPPLALQMTASLGRIDPTSTMDADAMPSLELQAAAEIDDSIIRTLVIAKAEAMMDVGYNYGSNTEDAVDCSALIQQAFKTAGIQLPRSSREMLSTGTPVQRQNLQAGDLMFFRWERRGLHVAMVLDADTIVHASSGNGRVMVSRLNSYWNRRLVGTRRLL